MDPYLGVPGRRDPAKGPLSPGREGGKGEGHCLVGTRLGERLKREGLLEKRDRGGVG